MADLDDGGQSSTPCGSQEVVVCLVVDDDLARIDEQPAAARQEEHAGGEDQGDAPLAVLSAVAVGDEGDDGGATKVPRLPMPFMKPATVPE